VAGVSYLGSALNAVDAKSRVSVPPSFREIVAARSTDRELMVAKSSFDDCLIAFDPTYLDTLRAGIEAEFGPVASREKAAAARRAYGSAIPLKIDDAHRLTLTIGLKEAAGVDKQAFFVGMDAYFEIWNPQTFLALPDADALLAGDLKRALARVAA
jgi:MraZ protein